MHRKCLPDVGDACSPRANGNISEAETFGSIQDENLAINSDIF